jgi:hypothetical protein
MCNFLYVFNCLVVLHALTISQAVKITPLVTYYRIQLHYFIQDSTTVHRSSVLVRSSQANVDMLTSSRGEMAPNAACATRESLAVVIRIRFLPRSITRTVRLYPAPESI